MAPYTIRNMLYNVITTTYNAFKDLVFPPICLHCGGHLIDNKTILCHSCIDLLHLIEPKNRCNKCFDELLIGIDILEFCDEDLFVMELVLNAS